MEDVYPQLLQALLIYNAPSWIQSTWSIFRPIMPKRVVEKIDIINPKKNAKEKNRLLAFLSEEDMPVALGGNNTTSPRDWYKVAKENNQEWPPVIVICDEE